MRLSKALYFSAVLIAALGLAACSGGPAASPDKVVKTTKSGDLTVTLLSPTGNLKNGDNDLMLTFADNSGQTVDVGAAALEFHMPAMGSMAEMNDKAALTTTEVPGKYRAQVSLQMGGTWEARIVYEGPRGDGRATMTVQAK